MVERNKLLDNESKFQMAFNAEKDSLVFEKDELEMLHEGMIAE